MKKVRVLFLCGREKTYTRNSVLLKSLKTISKVIDISSDNKNFLVRQVQELYRLFIASITQKFDVVFVGFYGQPLVPIVKLLTRKPIIFDAYISTYLTLCFDRNKFRPESIIGKLSFYLDKFACNLANTVLLDTNEHIRYFTDTYRIPTSKFRRIFVGVDEDIFKPTKTKVHHHKPKVVLFYGEYQPLHGVEYIIRAANILRNEDIKFKLIGDGSEKSKIETLIRTLKLKNIIFENRVPYKQLPKEISSADVVIGGHMGITFKAKMVIPGKLFQSIAMSKATIVAKNKANEELFGTNNKIYYVDPGNYEELAEKLYQIIFDFRKSREIGKSQYIIYKELASQNVITNNIRDILYTFDTNY